MELETRNDQVPPVTGSQHPHTSEVQVSNRVPVGYIESWPGLGEFYWEIYRADDGRFLAGLNKYGSGSLPFPAADVAQGIGGSEVLET